MKQIGYWVPIRDKARENDAHTIEHLFREAPECISLLAAKHRLSQPKREDIRLVKAVVPSGAEDKMGLDGSLGFRATLAYLPWYRGWLESLVARIILWHRHWK